MSVILVKLDGPKDAGYGNNQDKTYAYFCDYNAQPDFNFDQKVELAVAELAVAATTKVE